MSTLKHKKGLAPKPPAKRAAPRVLLVVTATIVLAAGLFTAAILLRGGEPKGVGSLSASPAAQSSRVAAITVAYAAFVGLVDALTGANYLYLRSKPAAPTLLDVMGPWPWYVLAAGLVALVLFFALDVLAKVGANPRPTRTNEVPPSPSGSRASRR